MAELPTPHERVRHLLRLVVNRPREAAQLDAPDLDLALRLARRARLLGRLAEHLESYGDLDRLPQTAVDQLVSARTMARARERLARWELDRIAWALRDAPDTPLVALKGCAYLLLDLPNAPGRVFADVDLLTDEARLGDVEARLNRRGWQTMQLTPYDQNYYRNWTHELPPLRHRDREMEIDLHHNILPRTARLKPDGTKLLRGSRALPGSRYRVPANEDIVLHAMAHLMFADDLADKLRDLVDIGDLLAHFSAADEGFWPSLLARATELDLERPAWYSLRYLGLLLDADIPQHVVERIQPWGPARPVQRLMDMLAPRALFPLHPDGDARLAPAARQLLYVRSHWIRMPPWLLAYHLAYKFTAARIRRRPRTSAGG